MSDAERRIITGVEVRFHTTRDDKDKEESIYLDVYDESGKSVAATSYVAGTDELWDNDTFTPKLDLPPFLIRLNSAYQTGRLTLGVSKTGTTGWIFRVRATGIRADGSGFQLVPEHGDESDEVDLRDDRQNARWKLT